MCVSGPSTNQVVIWSNTKEFPEVTEGNRSVGLKAKVTVVMSRSQVTAFTENMRESQRQKSHHKHMKSKPTNSTCLFNSVLFYQPGEEDTFNHNKVLHENIPFCLLA